jgi:hypothetical protein
MNKFKYLSCIILVICFSGISIFASENTEANALAKQLLRGARNLLDNATCARINLSLKSLKHYQELREAFPDANIPDKKAAVNEVQVLLNRNCSFLAINTWKNLIPGGVKCGACMPTGEEAVSFDIPLGTGLPPGLPPIKTPTCNACDKVDIVTLALIYIDPKERSKFLEKLPPPVQVELRRRITDTSNPAIFDVQRSVDTELKRTPVVETVIRPADVIRQPVVSNPAANPGVLPSIEKPTNQLPKINEKP